MAIREFQRGKPAETWKLLVTCTVTVTLFACLYLYLFHVSVFNACMLDYVCVTNASVNLSVCVCVCTCTLLAPDHCS